MIELGTDNKFKSNMKKESLAQGISCNYGYLYLFSRIFLQALDKADNKKFVLAGSFGNFAHIGCINRPITDIDLTTNESANYVYELFNEIKYNNSINFQVEKIKMTDNDTLDVVILCSIEKIKQIIKLDVKPNYHSNFTRLEIPTLFSTDVKFPFNVINYDDMVAGKLFSVYIKMLIQQNGEKGYIRYKDFYDLHYVIEYGKFNSNEVKKKFNEKIRNSPFLNKYFNTKVLDFKQIDSENREEKWNETNIKYGLKEKFELDYLVEEVEKFLKDNLQYEKVK